MPSMSRGASGAANRRLEQELNGRSDSLPCVRFRAYAVVNGSGDVWLDALLGSAFAAELRAQQIASRLIKPDAEGGMVPRGGLDMNPL